MVPVLEIYKKEREQAEMMKKQQLLALQIEMIQNELKQSELIQKLQATEEKIQNCQTQNNCQTKVETKRKIAHELCQQESVQERVASRMGSVSTIPESTTSALSSCDYYFGPISWQKSSELLKDCSEGTFLVRDSQDPMFMYSLSFQRGEKEGGPTSIRIPLDRGRWSLDCQESLHRLMPCFTSIGGLIQYYVDLTVGGNEDYPIKLRKGLKCKPQTAS